MSDVGKKVIILDTPYSESQGNDGKTGKIIESPHEEFDYRVELENGKTDLFNKGEVKFIEEEASDNTEWLTTGQMIDRLKIGENAESDDGIYTAKWNDRELLTFVGQFSDSYVVNLHDKKRTWHILPKYVPFEEAKKAYEKGRKIKCEYISVINENEKRTQTFQRDMLYGGGEITWYMITEGKWSILD